MATQVPLRILITDPAILEDPTLKAQIETLAAQGHTVSVDNLMLQYDFITGPNCWFLRPEVAGLFSMAINNARKVANADKTRTALKKEKKVAKPRKAKAKVQSPEAVPEVPVQTDAA
jgi:hypothetical protein